MFPIFNIAIAAVILTFVIFVSTLIILYGIIK